jgi:hypothetical protein
MQTLRKFTVPRRISLSNFNLASIANLPSAVPSINRRFDNVLILNVWWTDGRETKEKEDTVNDKKEKKGQKKGACVGLTVCKSSVKPSSFDILTRGYEYGNRRVNNG